MHFTTNEYTKKKHRKWFHSFGNLAQFKYYRVSIFFSSHAIYHLPFTICQIENIHDHLNYCMYHYHHFKMAKVEFYAKAHPLNHFYKFTFKIPSPFLFFFFAFFPLSIFPFVWISFLLLFLMTLFERKCVVGFGICVCN